MSQLSCSDSFTILGLWVLGLAVSNINESQLQTYESKTLFLMTSLQYYCIPGLAGTRWNKNSCAKDAGCAGNKITGAGTSMSVKYIIVNASKWHYAPTPYFEIRIFNIVKTVMPQRFYLSISKDQYAYFLSSEYNAIHLSPVFHSLTGTLSSAPSWLPPASLVVTSADPCF